MTSLNIKNGVSIIGIYSLYINSLTILFNVLDKTTQLIGFNFFAEMH
ncbi:MAG: hypothetical protein IT238_11150 [Bacteroidia bacterium]|nr:hypothetical protein [Bacteroidia bacterium]